MVGRIMSAAGGHVRRSFLEHLFFIFVMVQPAKNNVSLQTIWGGVNPNISVWRPAMCPCDTLILRNYVYNNFSKYLRTSV